MTPSPPFCGVGVRFPPLPPLTHPRVPSPPCPQHCPPLPPSTVLFSPQAWLDAVRLHDRGFASRPQDEEALFSISVGCAAAIAAITVVSALVILMGGLWPSRHRTTPWDGKGGGAAAAPKSAAGGGPPHPAPAPAPRTLVDRVRSAARWTVPRFLPFSVVAATILFSEWMYAGGDELTSGAVAALLIAWLGAKQLSMWSWMQASVAGGVIFVHHAVLVLYAAGVGRHEGLPSFSAPSAHAVEAVVTVFIILRSIVLIPLSMRADEREAREDFILEYRTKVGNPRIAEQSFMNIRYQRFPSALDGVALRKGGRARRPDRQGTAGGSPGLEERKGPLSGGAHCGSF